MTVPWPSPDEQAGQRPGGEPGRREARDRQLGSPGKQAGRPGRHPGRPRAQSTHRQEPGATGRSGGAGGHASGVRSPGGCGQSSREVLCLHKAAWEAGDGGRGWGGVMGGGRGGGGSWRREPRWPPAEASVCHAGKLQGPGRGWTGTRGSLIPAPLCHPGGFLPTSPGALKVRGHQSAAQSATKGPSRMWAPWGTKPWPHPPPHSGRATLEGQSPLPTFRLGNTGKWLPRPAPWPGPPSSPAGPARQASPPRCGRAAP